jgi:alpha-2-macroglobulin
MRFQYFASLCVSVVTCFALNLAAGSVARAAEVLSVNPTGSVKRAQQVVVKFSTDMVPMGDPRSLKNPFEVTCTGGKDASSIPKAKGRWVDSKAWSYDFDKPLPSGIKCILTKRVEKDLSGVKVTALGEYKFSTGGPALLAVMPRYGEIEPDQYFVVQTDGPMNEKSVEEKAFFESEKLQAPIGVRVITGADRDKVLRAAVASEWQLSAYKPMIESGKPLESFPVFQAFQVLAAKNRFAEGSKVSLKWPVGILSSSGVPVDEPQHFEFQVIHPFTAKFSCERSNPDSPCNPILNMRLEFSRPVDRKLLTSVKLTGPSGQVWMPLEFDKKAKKGSYRDGSDFLSALTFTAPFPDRSAFKVSIPNGLKDELGRVLTNQKSFPLEVKTDDFTPLVKFAAVFGILERNADPILPVSVRNVEKTLPGVQQVVSGKTFSLSSKSSAAEVIRLVHEVQQKDFAYERRSEAFVKDSSAKKFTLPKPGGERDFELIGIPLKEPGLHVVELQSPRLGKALLDGPPMFVASVALVTNLGVHLKKGRESSLVWVTTLDEAKPVAGAEVSLLSGSGKTLATGKTDASGIWRVGDVKYPCAFDSESRYGEECEVYAFAKNGDDMSFVSNRWSQGIEDYRFNLKNEYLRAEWGPIVAHAVLDRALLQAGETLHFKTFLREYTEQGFKAFSPKRVPKRILFVHRASNKTFAVPFAFDAKTGTAVGEFKVPKDATLGFYEILLSQKSNSENKAQNQGDEGDTYDWSAQSIGNFMVAEYRLPMMESTVKIQGANLVHPKEVKVDLSASYLSGGPAADMKVKVRSSLNPGSFSPEFPGAKDYTFFSRPIKAGAGELDDNQADSDLGFVFNRDLILSKNGGALATVSGLPSSPTVRSLVVEMEYRDPNGEVKTGRAETSLFPSDVIVGLRADSWLAKAGKTNVAGIVVNPKGQPVKGQTYIVEAFRREYLTHRKRLVGGFYSYDSSTKTTSLGKVCEGKTDAKGEFHCEATKLPSGSVTLQAKATDREGRATLASLSLSIYEEGDFSWWTPSDSDRIDLLPEKTSYQPGETAKFVLRSPFPVSTVLVTVEREGVLDSFVRTVKRDNPVIDVPLKGHFAPNVFVSALALRGRVGDPKPTALVDLAKPAMKLGMSEIKVGWRAHELKVSVVSDKKRYRARDQAMTTIRVTRADGSPLGNDSNEVAIAVVDEALALLRKNWSLDLLSAMMGQRPLAVDTSSAQSQIIGKRHFGSKAKPPGGGGGGAGPENRELFDPLLLWVPRVKLNAKGEAQIPIKLNDSMTSFRISAVAQAGVNFFGSGSTVIESSKDLILYSGFAPVVRDGDVLKNQLTVRNTTAKPMKVELSVTSSQVPALAKLPSFDLKPSEAKIVEVPVTVPSGTANLEFTATAKDSIGGFSDSLKIKTRVQEAVPASVLQATLFQLEKPYSIPVQQPKDAIKDRGGLSLETRSTLVTGLSGVKSYMESYPYSCLEQRISKAVVLEDRSQMKETLHDLPSYLDARGLLKFFPSSICGSEQLSRYVLQITRANGAEIAAETKERVLAGLKSALDGRGSCESWFDSFLRSRYRDEEKILMIDVLSEYGAFPAEAFRAIAPTPNLWKTTTVVALYRILERETTVANREALMKQIETILQTRVNYQGTLMNLQGDLDGEAAWRLFTSRDQEAIAVFGLAIDLKSWESDIGKVARGITARFKKGTWDTTTANAWGSTELRKFSAKFEKEKVAGRTAAKSAGVDYALDWTKKPIGEKVVLNWPTGSSAKPVPVSFTHEGGGKPWLMMQTISAIPLKAPLDMGYSVLRKVTRVSVDGSQEKPGPIQWKSGDVANIELTITAKYDHPWVVVRDPIPAGASHLGTGLDGGSNIMDRAPKTRPKLNQITEWPAEFNEKSQSHFISYAAYVMKGTYKTNYRIRLNSNGQMKMPPTHVEAMYSPEAFGDAPIGTWSIAP